ncbi:MAG: NUDIX domain-containing protein [Sphingomonadaceae bacterium]|nr:NUDIX domain-containing protein [Sphingomonadaceae bacterium]
MRNIVNALLLREGKVLLARRSRHRKAYPDLWSFPGGHVEGDETLVQALCREVSEEISIIPLAYHPITRISDPNATAEPIYYHLYAVTAWEGRVRQGGVISAVAVGHRQAALAVMCRG